MAVPDPASESDPADARPGDEFLGIEAANRAFYAAFEARDLDAMSEIWEHSDRVTCTHPGWATMRGWAQVSASWFSLFTGPQHLQFILTAECFAREGDVGWVTVDENLLDGDVVGGTVAALNVFVLSDGGWRMVSHHGAPVAR